MELRSNFREGAVGAVQGLITGFHLVFGGFAVLVWYLSTTRETHSISGTGIAVGFLVVMVLGGFVWAVRNPDGHRRRIEVIIWLFVFGFVLPMLFYATLALFGLSMVEIPFFLIPVVSYGSTLLIAYGVVYRLDYRLFLSKSADSVE